MKNRGPLATAALFALATLLLLLIFARFAPKKASAANAPDPQQYPMMDMVANKIIQKYQQSTCEQLWEEKAEQKNKPRSTQEQEAISILRNDPQMRAQFINKIAAPIANKMFECGMIP
jgi:hypothetical protein